MLNVKRPDAILHHNQCDSLKERTKLPENIKKTIKINSVRTNVLFTKIFIFYINKIKVRSLYNLPLKKEVLNMTFKDSY